MQRSRSTTTSPTTSTAATPSAASTAATRAPTAATSPTAATTSTASTTSTAAPSTAPTSTSTTTAATSTTSATLALAAAALRTSRSSPDVLSNRGVCSSSRGVGGGKGGGGAPLKEGRPRSASSSTYSNCTSLSCEEMLLEEVNSEGVIRATDFGVRGVRVQVMRSSATRGISNGNVDGRRQSPQGSGVRPTSASHASAGRDGGIAPAYGYFNFSPDKIDVPKLLNGRHDLITWIESIEPQLEIAELKKFVDGNDKFIQESERSTELLPQANYITLKKQGRQTGQRGNSGEGGGGGGRSSNTKSSEDTGRGKSAKGNDRRSSGSRRGGRRCFICGDPDHLLYDCPDRDDLEAKSVTCADSTGRFSEGRGTVPLKGETGKQILIPDVLYVPGVQANLLSAGQLKDSGVKLQDEGDEDLLVSAARDVLGRACFTSRVLCTDLHPCPSKSTTSSMEAVALRTIASATKSTPDKWHTRLAHVGIDTIKSSAKHGVAIGLDIKKSTRADLQSASCVGGKLARHTFPEKGSDTENALDVMHIDLCGPVRVNAMDGCLYFLLLKDRKTRFVWVRPIAKKSDMLVVFEKWLKEVERQTSKSVKRLRSDHRGEFLGLAFADLVEDKGILHNLMCPYTPQQNGMVEREMRTVVEAVRTMLLHMSVKHHWWHLALRQAVWVCNYLERASLPPRTTSYELLFEKNPDLMLARVEQGLGVLDLTNNHVVTTVEAIFNESMSLEEWKVEHGSASARTKDSSLTGPLLVAIQLLEAEDVGPSDDPSPSIPPSSKAPPPLPASPPLLAADLPKSASTLAASDERSIGALPSAPPIGIAGSRLKRVSEKPSTGEPSNGKRVLEKPSTGESSNEELASEERATGEQLDDGTSSDVVEVIGGADGELSTEEQFSDSDVVEVSADKPAVRCSTRSNFGKPPERLSYHACLPPTSYNTLLDDAQFDVDLPKLDPDMHADPDHRWDITNMTVKEALAN
ncbi:unnamed protein product [Closterium sp. NIES-53]